MQMTEQELELIKKAASHPRMKHCKGVKEVFLTLARIGLEVQRNDKDMKFTAAVNAQDFGKR